MSSFSSPITRTNERYTASGGQGVLKVYNIFGEENKDCHLKKKKSFSQISSKFMVADNAK